MNSAALEQHLRQTLEDCRLTRSERQALAAVLDDENPSSTELAWLRSRVFALATERAADSRSAELLSWCEGVVQLIGSHVAARLDAAAAVEGEACFSPGETCLHKITGLLGAARHRVDICVFTITDDRVSEAIVDAHRRGVSLRIITDDDKASDRGSDIVDLEKSGVPVAVDRSEAHMHHKFAIFDRSRLLTGSYNWTRSAARHNQENLVVTAEPGLVQAFEAEFDKLWSAYR